MAKIKIPEVVAIPNPTGRKLYFDNNLVEDCLRLYIQHGCTDIALRDEIMKHANELIRQVIKTHGLDKIYPGQDESAFMDLMQTAWIQIEKTLYKYRACPHCYKCYNIMKPGASILYQHGDTEYGIISPRALARKKIKCKVCKKVPDLVVYRGTAKVFNLLSQVARTVILAFIKKEGRDYKPIWSRFNICFSRIL